MTRFKPGELVQVTERASLPDEADLPVARIIEAHAHPGRIEQLDEYLVDFLDTRNEWVNGFQISDLDDGARGSASVGC